MENGEQRYPNREQLEAGMELAMLIGPGRATRFRQMLNMLEDLEQARDLVLRMAKELKKRHMVLMEDDNCSACKVLAEANDMMKGEQP